MVTPSEILRQTLRERYPKCDKRGMCGAYVTRSDSVLRAGGGCLGSSPVRGKPVDQARGYSANQRSVIRGLADRTVMRKKER